MAQILLIVVIAILSDLASAYKSVYKGEDCKECLSNNATWAGVCRSKYSSSISFCCTEDDKTTQTACSHSPLCSYDMEFDEIKEMVCPYEKYACGLQDT